MVLSLTIPDAQGARMIDAISARYGYTGFDAQGVAQTKPMFVREWVRTTLRTETLAHEQGQAAAAARDGIAPLDLV